MFATPVLAAAQGIEAAALNKNNVPLDHSAGTRVVFVDEILSLLEGPGPAIDGQIAP